MARSHPPTLIRLAERALRDECSLERDERLLVALSGGGDSSALVHVLSVLAPKLGFSVVAHGVDHGLRQAAPEELDLAARLCEKLAVPFTRSRVEVGAGGNLQARAREARYAALQDAADRAGATRIATAHHADDRAETVLMRLLNGAPPSGLGVLAPAEGRLVRPLVRARKSDVTRHLARHGIPHADDPSNLNRRFLRVRVRLDVMPLLEGLSPAIVAHLTAFADEALSAKLPILTDDAGVPVPLRNAHVREVRRALRLGRGTRIRISGGREIVVDPRRHELRLDRGASSGEAKNAGRAARTGQKGDAKPRKRG